MIQAVFQYHLVFLTTAIAMTLAVGVTTYVVAARRIDRLRAAFYGLWASSTIGPIILTTWGGSGILAERCTINPAVIEAFATTQGQLNVALFAPFGLFAVLATRRPFFSAAVGVLFTAIVETSQATVPFITRLCDTDDLVTNTVGVLAGAGIGSVICRRAHYGMPLSKTVVRRAAIAGTTASLLITATWVIAIEPVRAVPPTASPTASLEQVQALKAELKEAFGDTYALDTVSFLNNVDGPSTVNAPLPGGFAEMTWPDREKITVHFTPTSQGEGTYAYQIPGANHQVGKAEQAQQVATHFAQRYAPWALRDSKVRVWPVDANVQSLGWVVEWRRWQGKVLMPMRLDIVIEPSGRMTDLIARNVDDPRVPPVAVNEGMAWKKFESQHKIKPGQGKREEPVLLAERQGGEWRVHWRLGANYADTLLSATVDANTGDVTNSAAIPASGGAPPSTEGLQGP
ncbi:VanZ family protein [Streptomyces sp. NBC_00233]|uniref:VanZ family protein n=1 Tax=Streptomyces sp. NBC_00233 TaxID=2975686 RepID=UPI00224ED9D3|nr:VanZ family protein [Streptomyces sp. NBC_00233]MCX5226815.1 VanZ family protein [Streptomyces sp. NBC_00233]